MANEKLTEYSQEKLKWLIKSHAEAEEWSMCTRYQNLLNKLNGKVCKKKPTIDKTKHYLFSVT